MFGVEYKVSINDEPVETIHNILPAEGQEAILRKLVENLGDLMIAFRDPKLLWYIGLCYQDVNYKTTLADIITEPTENIGGYKRQIWDTQMDQNLIISISDRIQIAGPQKTFQADTGTQYNRIINRFFLTTAESTAIGTLISVSNKLITPVQVTDKKRITVSPAFTFLT